MRKQGIFFILLTGLLAAAFTGAWQQQADARGENDGMRLHAFADAFMAKERTVTVKWAGPYKELTQPEQLASEGRALSAKLGLSGNGQAERSGSAFLYRDEALRADGVRVSLLLSDSGGGGEKGFLVVKLERAERDTDAAGAEDQSLAAAQREVSQTLEAFAANGRWQAMVQGNVKAGIEPKSVLQAAETKFHARPVERYADNGTVSVSYAARDFMIPASDESTITLQVALHRHSETGIWRLTVGTPIITSEY